MEDSTTRQVNQPEATRPARPSRGRSRISPGQPTFFSAQSHRWGEPATNQRSEGSETLRKGSVQPGTCWTSALPSHNSPRAEPVLFCISLEAQIDLSVKFQLHHLLFFSCELFKAEFTVPICRMGHNTYWQDSCAFPFLSPFHDPTFPSHHHVLCGLM